MMDWDEDPNQHLPLPLNDTIREQIRTYFAGHIGRAFDAIEPDKPGARTIYGFEGDTCCRSEFYRAMRGEWIRGTKVAHIEQKWALYEKGRREVPPVPRESGELKQWIQAEFGFLRTLHKTLFADCSYATLCNMVAGIGREARRTELLDRLDQYREEETGRRKRHREEENARDIWRMKPKANAGNCRRVKEKNNK